MGRAGLVITDAGRAHLAAVEADRNAKRAALQAARDDEATDLSRITIGCYVWLRRDLEGDNRIAGGIVADANDTHVWLVDDTATRLMIYVRRDRNLTQRPHAGLRMVPLADVERWEPRDATTMHARARALWLEAGAGAGPVTDDDLGMVNAGVELVRETKRGQDD